MSETANFMGYFALASFYAFLAATFIVLCVMTLGPLLADLWRDFWRERP